MKVDINTMKEQLKRNALDLKKRSLAFYEGQIKRRAIAAVLMVRSELIEFPDKKEKTRRFILLFAAIFLLDYLMYCLHTDKNIVDLFPEIPSLAHEKKVSVYLPSLDGATMIHEKRAIPVYDSDEKTAKLLFEIVVKGSIFDNTAMAVPANMFVRKVWIQGRGAGKKICVIDVDPAELRSSVVVIKNSESLFKRAVEKTITENIPSVKSVLVLEKGIPGTALWEL